MIDSIFNKLFELGLPEAVSLLASACEKLVENNKKKNDWKNLIVGTGDFFLTLEKEGNEFFSDLSTVLSRENLTKIAEDSKDKSGFSLKIILYRSLMQLMSKYEIPYEIADAYSTRIMYEVLRQLEIIDPEKYGQYFLEEWKEEQDKTNQEFRNKLDKMSQDLAKYAREKVELCSSGEMDLDLKRRTQSPSIGVDFFVVDDEHFQDEFVNNRFEEIIYVRGRCREETIYCILNELRRLNEERQIYVVKNPDSWEKLVKNPTENNIYIPWFYADEIPSIEHNTNIFVFDENTPVYKRNLIELRPRTQSTILKCLQNAGLESEEAYKLINDTHGLYIPMKKQILKGEYLKHPAWLDGISEKAKKVCLLLGKWEETEGDKLVIQSLYGDSYEKFLEEIRPYTSGDDPFLYIYSRNSSNIYYLASTENTWACLDVSFTESIWKTFIDIVIEVLNESENLFTYDSREKIVAQINGEKFFWSKTLRKGMLTTLIIKSTYKKGNEPQIILNNLVKRVLDFVQTEKQWSYIAEFWVELCEIAPDIILDRLYKELESTTGLLELFVKQTSDFIFSRNPYVDILWGVEQFLVQKKYFWRGFRWLLELDKKGYTFTSNSPKDTFSKIFCIWHNFSALETAEEKIKAAEIAIEQDEETAWNYIFDSIDNNGGSIIGELSSPKYREHKIPRDTTNRDMYEARHAYLNILLSHMDFSTKRWEKIIDLTENMTDELRQEIFDKLLQDICHMSDLDVITIKNHIRQIIYRHRYYSSSSWAMSEENVIVYEELLNRIYSKVPEYEFGYLFTPRWDLALLHPIPYGSNNEDKSNEKIKQKIIQEQINVFQKNGYSIFVLAELLARESYSPLGLYLAEYWNNGEWDFDLFTELLSAQKSGQFAIDYLRSSTKDDVSLYPEIINKLLRIGCTDEVLAQVYRCEASKTKKLPLITNEKEHIKKIFWQSSIFCDDCNVYWAIHEAKKYGMLNVFLEQIFDSHHKKPFSALDIFEFFEDVEKVPYSSSNQMTGYYADSLLGVLQDSFLDNPDRCMRVVQLEIYFSNLIDWNHMKCFHHVIKVSPELFAQLIAIVFRRDDGKSSNKETSELVIQNTYSLYQKTHFCPTEENGNVYEEKLEQWIEKFRDLLEGNNQVSLLSSILGRLFSFSPLGSDGHEPCEAVRKMIEKYGDEEMIQSYRTSVYNRRGVFSPSAGKEEMEMAKEFLRNAEFLEPNYPNTAKVFYELSESYIRESEQARKDAENGW